MGVMNIATYGFTMVAARLLGPRTTAPSPALMALLLVVAVLQLGLQATAARRIAADPGHVAQIERAILRVTYRAVARRWACCAWSLSPVIDRVAAARQPRHGGPGRAAAAAADDDGRPGRHPPGRAPLVAAGPGLPRRAACPGWSSAPP